MNRSIVGLLPVDPHRLYAYWDAPLPAGGRLHLLSVCRSLSVPNLPARGGFYFDRLEPLRAYAFELWCGDCLVARSNLIELPPDSEAPSEPAQAPSSHRPR